MNIEQIRDKYTAIKECVVDGEDELHYTVWLKVGPQSFCVTNTAYEKKYEAMWFQVQLAKALLAMAKELAVCDAK